MRSFFKEGTPNFDMFSSVVFYGRINLKQVEEQKMVPEGSGACSPGKALKIHVL